MILTPVCWTRCLREDQPGSASTAEYDLDHIQDAYEAMDQRKVIKALIRL